MEGSEDATMRVLFKVGNKVEASDESYSANEEEMQSDDSQNDI